MNATNSSFDPLEYYRQLTRCLANKKKLKLNLSKVPGAREYCNPKKSPVFTEEKLREKFLAKYNLRRQQEAEEEKRQNIKQVKNQQNRLNFHVKQNHNLIRVNKRKNEKDDYINLPDDFFKGIKLPDIPMLKLTRDPDPKRPKLNEDSSMPIQSNFTFSSLFSGNFNPQKNSTPISNKPLLPEKSSEPMLEMSTPKSNKLLIQKNYERIETPNWFEPLISDPNDILSSISENNINPQYKKLSQRNHISTHLQDEKGNISKYYDIVERVAKTINLALKVTDSLDPCEEFFDKLIDKYECVTQSPRNSMLHTNARKVVENTPMVSEKIKKPIVTWPVPVFYDKPQENEEEKSIFMDDETRKLFEFDPDYELPAYFDFKFDTPKEKDGFLSPPFNKVSDNFFSMTNTPNSTQFSFNIPESTLLFDDDKNFNGVDIDDSDIFQLEKAFKSTLKMDWETGSNFTIESPNIDLSIFRSPPKMAKSRLCLEERFSRTISRPSRKNSSKVFSDGLDWMNTSINESTFSFNMSQGSNFFENSFSFF